MDTGRGQLADIQFSGDCSKGQNIIVAVRHLVGDKFLVFLSDEIISALVDKQIALKDRLFVIGSNARLETAVGSFDIAVAVINANDNGIGGCVVHKIHIGSFLPHSGDTKIMDGFGKWTFCPLTTLGVFGKWTKCPLAICDQFFGGGHFDHHHLIQV